MKPLLVLLLVVAWRTAAARPADGSRAIIDRTVAVVGGSPIWKSEVDDMIKAAKAQPSPEVVQKVIDELIDQHLMLQAADEQHITSSDAEIDAAIQQIQQQNHINDAQLDTALADAGLTRAKYRVELAHQIKLEKWMQLVLGARINVHASEDADEFARQLDAARRAWIEDRKQTVHIERRQ
jgi:peptidyl-prolyl cis-trans isomerase SurA